MLNIECLQPDPKHRFKKFDLDFWCNPYHFQDLGIDKAQLQAIPKSIEKRNGFLTNRETLVDILMNQYKPLNPSEKITTQIQRLKEKNTFTVCCAHQPLLLGGTWYWLYKIIHTIKLAQLLNNEYPKFHFIPVYYCGTEDHDFEEIRKTRMYSHELIWNETAGGPVGRMPVNGLHEIFVSLREIFSNEPHILEWIQSMYVQLENCKDYASFFRYFFHEMFGKWDMLFLNPDDLQVKQLFLPILERELFTPFIEKTAQGSLRKIVQKGYDVQATPREINLFFTHNGIRKRILKNDQGFSLADTDLSWSRDEFREVFQSNPLQFSPNVLCRPLLQEFILPNIAFIGGGGEIAYWIELQEVFEAAGIPYPLIMRRFSGVFLEKSVTARIAKFELRPSDFFEHWAEIEQNYLKQHDTDIKKTTGIESEIELFLHTYVARFTELNASSLQSIDADRHKMIKLFESLNSKIIKAIKAKHQIELEKLRKIQDVFFPEQQLQERYYNFLPVFFRLGDSLVEELLNACNPFEPQMLIISES